MYKLKWPIIIFCFIFIIGFFGFLYQDNPLIPIKIIDNRAEKSVDYGLDKTYDATRLLTNNYDISEDIHENIFLNVARFAIAIVFVFTALFAFNFFIPDNWKIQFRVWKGDHIVICGGGNKGTARAKKCIGEENGKRNVIVIEKNSTNENNPSLREEGAYIVEGDAKQEKILNLCNIKKAYSIHIYVDDDSTALAILDSIKNIYDTKSTLRVDGVESDQDYKGVFFRISEISKQFFKIFTEKMTYKGPCNCYINLLNSELCLGLKNSLVTNKEQYGQLKIYILNTDFIIGESLFTEYKKKEPDFFSLEKQRTFIIGTGPVVEYFIINFLHSLYLIDTSKTHGIFTTRVKRPHITIIDPEADCYIQYLDARYPNLRNHGFIDAVTCRVKSKEFLQIISKITRGNLFIVCLPEDYISIEGCLLIDEGLKRNELIRKKIPVVVKIRDCFSINSALAQMKYKYSTLQFVSIQDKIINTHFPEYDLFSGLIEWAKIAPQKTLKHRYSVNKKIGSRLLYEYLMKDCGSDKPNQDFKDYPEYLVHMSEKIEDPPLQEFLLNPNDTILDTKPSYFEEYWKRIEDVFHVKPKDFYHLKNLSTETRIRVAQLFAMQGNYDEAQVIVEDISKTFYEYNLTETYPEKDSMDYKIYKFHLLKAKIYQNNGRIGAAEEIYARLKDRVKSEVDKKFSEFLYMINGHQKENEMLELQSINEEIKNYTQTLNPEQIPTRFSELSMVCYNKIGTLQLIQNESTSAIKSFNEVKTIAIKNMDNKVLTIAYNNLGLAHTVEAISQLSDEKRDIEFRKALKCHWNQEKLSESINYRKGLQRAWGNSAIVYRMNGNYTEALTKHTLEKEECRRMQYRVGLASAYNNLAIIEVLSKKGESKKNLNKQLILAHKINERVNKALFYGNYALVCYTEGRIDQAIVFNEMALMLSINDKTYLGGRYSALSEIVKTLIKEYHKLDLSQIIWEQFNDIIEPVFNNPNEPCYFLKPSDEILQIIFNYCKNIFSKMNDGFIDEIDIIKENEIEEKAWRLIATDAHLLFNEKIEFDKDLDKVVQSIYCQSFEKDDIFLKVVFQKAKNNREIFREIYLGMSSSIDKCTPVYGGKKCDLMVFDDLTPAPIIK